MLSADTIHGPMELIADPDDLICRSLVLTGEWGHTETAIFASALSAEDFVWDAGAFIGTFSLGVRRLSGARVLAIEPDPQAAAALRRNLDANAGGGCEIAETALGAAEGTLRPVLSESAHNRGTQRFEPAEDALGDAIPCTTLPRLRARYGDYTALKLDIEGAEFETLSADARFIRETSPLVWAECNETRAVERLLGFFLWAGLKPVYVAFPAFRRASHRTGAVPIFPIAYEAAICGGGANRFRDIGGSFAGEEVIVRPLATFQDLKQAMWDTPRWGCEDWARMSRPQLIARLGRMERGERFGGFLGEAV